MLGYWKNKQLMKTLRDSLKQQNMLFEASKVMRQQMRQLQSR